MIMKHFLAVVLAAALTGGVKASEMGVLRGHLKGRDENDFARRMLEKLSPHRELTGTCTQYPTIDGDCGHGPAACFTLYAGQTIPVGEVCAAIDGTNLEVTYIMTAADWYIDQVHLWAGYPAEDVPHNRRGNTVPGQFPHKHEYGENCPGQTEHTFTIPLSDILECCDTQSSPTLFIAAHAAVYKCDGGTVVQTETGWSDGDPITDQGNWGTISELCLTCGENGGGGNGGGCETAFAHYSLASTCFLNIDENGNIVVNGDFNRWGWSNGPFDWDLEATYTLEIYAGAGQCDIAKGTHVGYLTVVVEANGVVTVTYNALTEFEFHEFHLYIGTEILPRDNGEFTLAPGQYPYGVEVDPAQTTHAAPSVTVSDDFYVVAHSVSCEVEACIPAGSYCADQQGEIEIFYALVEGTADCCEGELSYIDGNECAECLAVRRK